MDLQVPMDGVSGPRSSALSELASLEHGETLQELPPYQMPATFQEPLSAAGLAKEQEMMSGLTQEIYQKYLDGLTDFPSRSLFLSNERQEKLLSFLKRKFKNMGYSDEQICVHTSSAKGLPPVHNVVVFIPGSAPGTVTMGAHYDSIPPRGEAPGAVDNGSGSAAVLAMARAWKEANVTPRKSLYFALFGGEEEGLWGSDAFAEALRSENSSNPLPPKCRPSAGGRHAAITMDMIGWRNPRFPADTVTMETKRWASGFFPLLAQSNNVNNRGNLKLLYSLKPYGSDHESFLNRGMPAILLIDNDGDAEAYPCYHKACDEKSNVDARLATEICKMNLGAFLRIARVQ
ncbi:unnamed protein product [Effrenium voratum]|nr:unnamed protein product [Effrenium voratum]